MRRIEFFNREKEKEEILNILKTEPQLINFIYGPINSGKTTLITNLIENLPENYVVIYVNLRERLISSYKDFLEAIFDVKSEGMLSKITRFLRRQTDSFNGAISDVGKMYGIPISRGIFSRIFTGEKPKDAFIYILNLIKNVKSKGKTPIFIIDELQKIGDVKVDNYLIYDVFNFFIRLTKELHICHVFILSSDSLFIERVYSEAMLQGRAKYILVDDFDEETAKKFLERYKFTEPERDIVWTSVGGKPMDLITIILAKLNEEDVKQNINKKIQIRKSQIKEVLTYIRDFGDKVAIGENKYPVNYDDVIKALSEFKEAVTIESEVIAGVPKRYIINKNILFVDPTNSTIKPQSKVDLIAIREILKEMK